MLSATLLLLVALPFLVEWALGGLLPVLWRRPRWVVLPLGNALLGGWLTLDLLDAVPAAEHGLGAFLGLAMGCLAAVFGAFRAAFWSGPSEAAIAMTGRRSMHLSGQRRPRRHP